MSGHRLIETEAQRDAALSWIAYWKAGHTTGEQSWLADEQSLGTIMGLQQMIADYEIRRTGNDTQNHAAG